ncbi:hypothetical protein, partial [Nocardioides sp.]|uniref:hypothetical protein n=1 Tax=Nocardioides sp. TaxID=35761 RepID=UPI002733F04E
MTVSPPADSSARLGHDLLADSARTWRDRAAPEAAIPEALRPPAHAGARERWRLLWQRHALR